MSKEHTTWKRLGSGELPTEDAHVGLGHILPFSVYLRTFVALLLLTVVTVWAAHFDFGNASIVVAILIASIKAGLVMSFFMHLKFEGKLIILYALYPFVVLFLLIGGTYMDELDRPEVLPRNVTVPSEDLSSRGPVSP